MKENTPKRRTYAVLKRVLVVLTAVVLVAGLAAGFSVRAAVKSVPRLFVRNADLKAQGYYMGEFEFKMLAPLYYLNQGSYLKAYTTLRRVSRQTQTTQGLVKMPQGTSLDEQMAFLLERQDPATGAFMDPAYPFFTYVAPTLNVVEALNDLAHKTGRPLNLKYPLRFLDEIRSPQQLRAYLDSLLYIQERWAGMAPVGPYVAGVSELAYFDCLEQAGVYRFTDEWKDALRQWFYDTQDPKTGSWGDRIGTPDKWRQRLDLNSTYHVLHLVLDERGGNRSQKYPLRCAATLARNILELLAAPLPDDPTQQHDWGLAHCQGAGMITRLLWPHLSEPERELARTTMRTCVTSLYRLFRPADGGFAFYTSATRSDVDGTGLALGLLQSVGTLPGTWERDRLWAGAIASVPAPVRTEVHRWNEASMPTAGETNSIRVFTNSLPAGDTYDDVNLVQIIYPKESPVLDVMDLRQHIAGFLAMDGQMFGNWTPKEHIRNEPLDLRREIRPIPVSHGPLDLAQIAAAHPDAQRFFIVGYDLFQVPLFSIEFVKTGGL